MREANDLYPTPIKLVEAAVRIVRPSFDEIGIVLDVGAGNGVWGMSAMHPDIGARLTHVYGIDIDPNAGCPSFDNYWNTDYLTFDMKAHFNQRPSLIVSNPPFSHAIEFVEKALKDVSMVGQVLMLLRVGVLGSKKRREFWARPENQPTSIHLCVPRPSFSGGGTDASEYAIYNWDFAKRKEPVRFDWLNWR